MNTKGADYGYDAHKLQNSLSIPKEGNGSLFFLQWMSTLPEAEFPIRKVVDNLPDYITVYLDLPSFSCEKACMSINERLGI